jgi:adenylate kinase
MHKPFSLILLGDPASGKTTQAELVAKKYGMTVLDMGRELRKLSDKEWRGNGEDLMNRGKLAPTVVVRRILAEKIRTASRKKGLLLSGTPRMAQEARIAARLLGYRGGPAYLGYISLTVAEAKRRAMRRGRVDDKATVWAKRKKIQAPHMAAVVRFFKNKYPYARISGEGSKVEVFRRIDAFLKTQLKNEK